MRARYHLGCSGYFYWGWRGKWYPHDLSPSQWFEFYSQRFDTVEINSTFYRFPTPSAVRRWYREAPRDFLFAVKVPRTITHLKKLVGAKRLIREFYRVLADGLGEKLGCVLFQMPPSFRFSRTALDRLLDHLDTNYRNAVEFRHASWWNREVYRSLEESQISFCAVSAPRLPQEIVRTAPWLYLRFHGAVWYRYEYSREELEEWARRIRGARAREVFAYFNNDYQAFAPKNCEELRRLLYPTRG